MVVGPLGRGDQLIARAAKVSVPHPSCPIVAAIHAGADRAGGDRRSAGPGDRFDEPTHLTDDRRSGSVEGWRLSISSGFRSVPVVTSSSSTVALTRGWRPVFNDVARSTCTTL